MSKDTVRSFDGVAVGGRQIGFELTHRTREEQTHISSDGGRSHRWRWMWASAPGGHSCDLPDKLSPAAEVPERPLVFVLTWGILRMCRSFLCRVSRRQMIRQDRGGSDTGPGGESGP